MKSVNPIKKKHRDIAMQAICDFHAHRDPGHSIGPKYLYYHGLPESIDANYLVEILQSMGYITCKKDIHGNKEISLTDVGKHYFETNMDLTHEKRVEWIRYIITTGIAVSAFVKSFFF